MSKDPQDHKNQGDVAETDTSPTSQNAPRDTTAGPSRIVGNQAKKQEEVTRQGTQKMKFVPTLPIRRKKPDAEVKQEETAASLTTTKSTERGRGRGRGLGRGRGGPPAPRPEMQMTASGPFAMGPALAGSSSKRRVPRSNFTPVMPSGPGPARLGEGLSRTEAPTLREKESTKKDRVKEDDDDVEVYSDPDEGVEIVDMDVIKTMDWMAPESLRRERDEGKNTKKKKKVEAVKKDTKGKGKAVPDDEPTVENVEEEVEKNLANALDLSESEEEEEMEDLIEDFAIENEEIEDEDSLTRHEKLYFFQFPHPFPTISRPTEGETMDVDAMVASEGRLDVEGQKNNPDKGKKVSFAQDVKPPAPNGSQEKVATEGETKEGATAKPALGQKLDGIIGQLEVHRSGMIKMRLGNGMLMDVTAATQPSFLQHAVFLDPTAKKMHVLGEVNRRFVVSPDVDKLLEEMDKEDAAAKVKSEAVENPMT